jgi:type II secretory pathway pseudopilin PulG
MRRFTLSSLLAVVAMAAVATALAVPRIVVSRRTEREKRATAALKMITTAEADMRANDREGNLVNDFWTADVYGLYGLIPVSG